MLWITALCSLYNLTQAGSIVSNFPVVVTTNKSFTSTNPAWVTSAYFRAGYEDVIKVFTGSNVPSTDYTFTFSSALPGIPNLAYGIKRYRGNDYLGQQFYQIKKTELTPSTFSVSIQIFGVTNLWILSVAYLAVDPTFPHHLNSFDNVPINATGGGIQNISIKSNQLAYYTQYINYTWQTEGRPFRAFTQPLLSNKIVLFMTSLWIQGTFGTLVKFHVYTEVLNATFYMWNVTLEQKVMVTNVHFSLVVFNSDDVLSSEKYFIVYSLWYNDRFGGFISIPQQFIDNFIMGVTTFQCLDANCGFEYQWVYTNKTIDGKQTFGVQLLESTTLSNRAGFSWSQTSIFYMMTWSCPAPYSFFNLSSQLCQDFCGGFYYENTNNPADLRCTPCPDTECYQCDPSNPVICTYCASYLYFELVEGVCVCMSGYLHANKSCLPCWDANVGCYNCSYEDGADGTLAYDSSLFECLDCNNTQNYFLDGLLCVKCTLSNCVFCQNLTACSVCSDGYNFSAIQTCILCHVTGCTFCALTDPEVCETCSHSKGYYEDSSNLKCKTICGDGIYVAANESCDDGNLDNYDGCSSTCLVQSHFSCGGSPSQCYFAENVTIGLFNQSMESEICDTITFGFSFDPASQTFAQPNIQWQQFLWTPNQSLLILNQSMLYYVDGVLWVSYFLMGHLQNKTLLFTANFSALLPNSSIFSLSTAVPWDFQVSTIPEALMVCCTGFYMLEEEVRCAQICGDGMVFYLACDDNNTQPGDGCSGSCQIQPGYVCINGTPSSSSICSYNASISLALMAGDKIPGQNSMTLTYQLSPHLPLLALNDFSTDFSSLLSFDSPGVSITSAVLDSSSGVLVVSVDYSVTLQGGELLLRVTPPDVPQAFLVPVILGGWTVTSTNRLAVVAYAAEAYAKTESIRPYSNAIMGMGLLLVALSIPFRKFIGLELATLIQIGYLSLLQNPAITTYQQPITQWKYTFGYNELWPSDPPGNRFMSAYAIYGYQIYFGYSNNLMVAVTASAYLFAGLLLLLSMVSSKSTSRKFQKAAQALASELGYALAIFTAPNVLTALCIQAKEGVFLDTSLFWSKAALIGACIMLSVASLLQLSTAEQSSELGTFLRKQSSVGIYMPVVFSLRLLTLTVLLFVFQLTSDLPRYFIMISQLAYFFFILFGRLHKKGLDLFRALFIEFFLLGILFIRFLEVEFLTEYVDPLSSIFVVLAYLEYGCYGGGVLVSAVALLYHLLKKVGRSNEVESDEVKQDSPEIEVSVPNQSMHKLEEKSRMIGNGMIFDIEEMSANVPTSASISLDSRPSPRKLRRKRKKGA